MSNRQSPRNSKSKSCHCRDDNEETNRGIILQEAELEEMERQLEEDIATSERLIHAASSIMARSRGRMDGSREEPRPQPSDSINQTSYLGLPSPPQQSPSPFGSRVQTTISSQNSSAQSLLTRADFSTPIDRDAIFEGQRTSDGNLINPGDVDYFNVEEPGDDSHNGEPDGSNANQISLGLDDRSRVSSSRGQTSMQSSIHLSPLANVSAASRSSPGQAMDSIPRLDAVDLSQGSHRHSSLREEGSPKLESSRFLGEMEEASGQYDLRDASNGLVNCQREGSQPVRSRTTSPIGADHQAQFVNCQREGSQPVRSRTTSPIGADHQAQFVNCQREESQLGRSRITSPTEGKYRARLANCQRNESQPGRSRATSPMAAEHQAHHINCRREESQLGRSRITSPTEGKYRDHFANCQRDESQPGRSRATSPRAEEYQSHHLSCPKERPQSERTRSTSPMAKDYYSHYVNWGSEGSQLERSRATSPTDHQAHHFRNQREGAQQGWSRAPIPTEAESHAHHSGLGNTSGRVPAKQEAFNRSLAIPSTSNYQPQQQQDVPENMFAKFMMERAKEDALFYMADLNKKLSNHMCKIIEPFAFRKVCSNKKETAKLPEMPCLLQEEINELIKCESEDVDTTNYLSSETRKTYKKPCPKQTKAQMDVKALMKAHNSKTCGENYTPLEHPDPEDISPEVAAKMMFVQEKGIKMEECPKATVLHLFPDEPKPPFPRVPKSTISIVDPNQKDREEMIEKSASVPSEGVSDSAYTRKMKEKGDDLSTQKSYDIDFAIGQSKREYVLVAQKPLRFSKVQYRGGTLPSWFPGYFAAFPDEDGSIKTVTSPSGLFLKAWMHTNPRNIPQNDVIVLE